MLAQDATAENASVSLDKLTASMFHHSMTSEEAYFVAEMAGGVDGAVAAKVSVLTTFNAPLPIIHLVDQQRCSVHERNA